jgi:DNA-binding response OmpR family regulator
VEYEDAILDPLPRVLYVDADRAAASLLVSQLNSRGFRASDVATASEAILATELHIPDMLLVTDGSSSPAARMDSWLDLLKLSASMGVIVLGGAPTTRARIFALDSGADDWISKPFDLDELCARIRAVLRRRGASPTETLRPEGWDSSTLRWGPLTLRPLDQVVVVAGVARDLTRTQTRLLARLIRASGALVSTEEIWSDFTSSLRPSLGNIRVHVHALRRRLDPHGDLIETWPGRGYSLRAVESVASGDS